MLTEASNVKQTNVIVYREKNVARSISRRLYTTLPRLESWLSFNRTLRFTKIVATIVALDSHGSALCYRSTPHHIYRFVCRLFRIKFKFFFFSYAFLYDVILWLVFLWDLRTWYNLTCANIFVPSQSKRSPRKGETHPVYRQNIICACERA